MASPDFIKSGNTRLWAFTVKYLSRKTEVTELQYEPFFKVLYQLSEVVTMCGEVDSKGILHYHGVIRLSDKFYRKNLRVKGYHLYLKRIYNLVEWIKYTVKQCEVDNTLECKWDKLQALLE